MSRRIAAFVLVVAALPGCKKHKPPPMAAVGLARTHACAQVERGAATCWGQNAAGQLGGAPGDARLVPSAAQPSFDVQVTAFALGERYSCARTAASDVVCRGESPVPAPLVGVRLLAGGPVDVCAVTDGGARCWGPSALTPSLPADARVVAVAVGGAHACFAVDAPERLVVCTGKDDDGQAARHQPVLRGGEVLGLTAGGSHTCAVTAAGEVRCWGANRSGQLGDGSLAAAATPVLVAGITGAAEVRAGHAHTCARSRTNAVSCWGDNAHHQLADGTTAASARPKALFGLVGTLELVAAGDATCARLTGGFVRCWGDNTHGQLGDGTTVDHDVPMPVKWR